MSNKVKGTDVLNHLGDHVRIVYHGPARTEGDQIIWEDFVTPPVELVWYEDGRVTFLRPGYGLETRCPKEIFLC